MELKPDSTEIAEVESTEEVTAEQEVNGDYDEYYTEDEIG
jgi:hypothetical protein